MVISLLSSKKKLVSLWNSRVLLIACCHFSNPHSTIHRPMDITSHPISMHTISSTNHSKTEALLMVVVYTLSLFLRCSPCFLALSFLLVVLIDHPCCISIFPLSCVEFSHRCYLYSRSTISQSLNPRHAITAAFLSYASA